VSKADLHLHTRFSDGLNNPRDVVQAAKKAGLQVIAITDHDTLEGAIRAQEYSHSRVDLGVEVILGEEISTVNGHVIGLFLKTFIPPRLTAKRTVELIHRQGGVAILPHPFHPYTGKSANFPRAVELIEDIPFDGLETLSQGEFYGAPFNAKAARLCQKKGLAAVGSSDAHDVRFVGMAHTEFAGWTGEDLRRSLLERHTKAVCARNWGVKDMLHHLKAAAPILSRYSKLAGATSA
jgi:predicted metal-dependent phosphoesterase TrpH